MSHQERAGCLNQLGDALLKHADEFFALSQVEWGCIANERVMQVDGAGYMSMHAAQLATELSDRAGHRNRRRARRCCVTSPWASCRS